MAATLSSISTPVAFLDCSGLRILCRAEQRVRDRGGHLRLVCPIR
ncbi:STAS domain-containing protein [Streptomyces umbrinus]